MGFRVNCKVVIAERAGAQEWGRVQAGNTERDEELDRGAQEMSNWRALAQRDEYPMRT
jgi:hypothetical protein